MENFKVDIESIEIEKQFAYNVNFVTLKQAKKIELKRHIKLHSYTIENTTCICKECEFKVNNAWNLQIHIEKAHGNQCEHVTKKMSMTSSI